MCGIVGFFSADHPFSPAELQSMTNALSHRGPDAEGTFCDRAVGLGHRRLSILDLSAAGTQPFHSRCGRYVMVFNGEVYNFREIAAQLGIETQTGTDTEVILEAYVQKGIDAIALFNGMFSIAIYDKEKETLFLLRDRLGVKPLFYYKHDGKFAFASEMKALLTVDAISQNLSYNQKAVQYFLHLGYIPEPHSIYNHIYKFPTGHYAEIKLNGTLKLTQYWSAEKAINKEMLTNEADASAKLEEIITDSIRLRLISDVPYGVFLSGGVDSSLVAAVAAKTAQSPINTFSIGFKESNFNEAPHAKNVAKLIGSNHEEYIVSQKDALDYIPKLASIYDEPYADASSIPTLIVSQMASKHVKMVLTGDGGDELFWGYGSYLWAKRLSTPLWKMGRPLLSDILLKSSNNKYKRIGHLLSADRGFLPSHIFSQEHYFFSENELKHVLTKTAPPLEWESSKSKNRKLSTIEEQVLFDINYCLKDDLLVKVDRATMYYGIEAREPLLDYRLAEFALNLAPELKLKGTTGKYLLKKLLYKHLPQELFERPKWGFSIPTAHWLQNELRPSLEEYTSKAMLDKYGFVNYKEVEDVKQRFFKGESYLYNRLFLIMMLHMWLEQNKV
jgi:asparagine synthase (glutamine-hydrolysing)